MFNHELDRIPSEPDPDRFNESLTCSAGTIHETYTGLGLCETGNPAGTCERKRETETEREG